MSNPWDTLPDAPTVAAPPAKQPWDELPDSPAAPAMSTPKVQKQPWDELPDAPTSGLGAIVQPATGRAVMNQPGGGLTGGTYTPPPAPIPGSTGLINPVTDLRAGIAPVRAPPAQTVAPVEPVQKQPFVPPTEEAAGLIGLPAAPPTRTATGLGLIQGPELNLKTPGVTVAKPLESAVPDIFTGTTPEERSAGAAGLETLYKQAEGTVQTAKSLLDMPKTIRDNAFSFLWNAFPDQMQKFQESRGQMPARPLEESKGEQREGKATQVVNEFMDGVKDIHKESLDEIAKEHGLGGSVAQSLVDGGVSLAINLAMLRGVSGHNPAELTGSTSMMRRAAVQNAKVSAAVYVSTPGTPEEKMKSALNTAAYMGVPTFASLAPSHWMAMTGAILANMGLNSETYVKGISAARAQAEKEGKPENWPIYAAMNLGPEVMQDIMFGIGTRSINENAYYTPKERVKAETQREKILREWQEKKAEIDAAEADLQARFRAGDPEARDIIGKRHGTEQTAFTGRKPGAAPTVADVGIPGEVGRPAPADIGAGGLLPARRVLNVPASIGPDNVSTDAGRVAAMIREQAKTRAPEERAIMRVFADAVEQAKTPEEYQATIQAANEELLTDRSKIPGQTAVDAVQNRPGADEINKSKLDSILTVPPTPPNQIPTVQAPSGVITKGEPGAGPSLTQQPTTEVSDAIKTGKEPEGRVGEHIGTARREDIRPYSAEVRKEEGQQAGGGDRAIEGPGRPQGVDGLKKPVLPPKRAKLPVEAAKLVERVEAPAPAKIEAPTPAKSTVEAPKTPESAIEQGLPVKLPTGTLRVRATFADGKHSTVLSSDLESLAGVGKIKKLEALQAKDAVVPGEITVRKPRVPKKINERTKPAETPAATPASLTPAYRAPDGQIVTGANHIEAAKQAGVEAPLSRTGRQTPEYGFVDEKGGFLNRKEAEEYGLANDLLREGYAGRMPSENDVGIHTDDLKAGTLPLDKIKTQVKPSESGVVDTIAGKMSLTEFEKKGYAPEQVTKEDWVNLQRAERRRLGQAEESGTPYAPYSDYEQFHKNKVKEAIARGEEVDSEVLKDYPDLTKAPEKPNVPPERSEETKKAPSVKPSTVTWSTTTAFLKRAKTEPVTAKEAQDLYASVKANKEALIAEVRALLDKDPRYAKKHKATKDEIAVKSYDQRLERFAYLGDEAVSWTISGGDFAASRMAGLDKAVAGLTDESIKKMFEKRMAESAELRKAVDNPETLSDFRTFVAYKGDEALTPEQRAKWDALRAEAGMQAREEQSIEKKGTVGQVEGAAQTPMEIVERPHTKRGHNVFIVTMGDRVTGDTFKELAQKARRLGGNWSREWKPTDSPAGFTFNDRDSADKFMSLRQGDVSRTEEVAAEKKETKEAAADRLTAMADKMESSGSEKLDADRMVNTARRARMADNAEADARNQIQLAKTIRNIASAVRDGRAKFLRGIRTKVQVEMLGNMLDRTRERLSEDKGYGPVRPEQAVFPEPKIHADNILSVARELSEMPGAKLMAMRLRKYSPSNQGPGTYPSMMPINRKLAEDIVAKNPRLAGWYLEDSLANIKRLEAMNVTNDAELRSALREYEDFRGEKPKEDKAAKLRREIVGQKVGVDYFPTPPALAGEVIRKANIRSGDTVLEPSAGDGQLANRVRTENPESPLSVVEQSGALRKILEAEGHNVVGEDFLEHNGPLVDRIVMNPPFSDNQDIQHVRHAFDLLKPGGRVVAVMSEHGFFASGKTETEFRDWLDEIGGTSEKNPDNSFMDRTIAGPTTGVATRTVVIDKPAEVESTRKAAEELVVAPTTKAALTPVSQRVTEAKAEPAKKNAITPEIVAMQERLNNREFNLRRIYGDDAYGIINDESGDLTHEQFLDLTAKIMAGELIGDEPLLMADGDEAIARGVERYRINLAETEEQIQKRYATFQCTDQSAKVATDTVYQWVQDNLPMSLTDALDRIDADPKEPLGTTKEDGDDVYMVNADKVNTLVAVKLGKSSDGREQVWLDWISTGDVKWRSTEAEQLGNGDFDKVGVKKEVEKPFAEVTSPEIKAAEKDLKAAIAKTETQKAKVMPPAKKKAPANVSELLTYTAEVPSVEAAQKASHGLIEKREEMRKVATAAIDAAKKYAEDHDLMTTKRRNRYQRGGLERIKTSAPKGHLEQYRQLQKTADELSAQFNNFDREYVTPAKRTVERANRVAVLRNERAPMLSRLAARLEEQRSVERTIENREDDTGKIDALESALNVEAVKMAREMYPDATDAEAAAVAPMIQSVAGHDADNGHVTTIEDLQGQAKFEARLQMKTIRRASVQDALAKNGIILENMAGGETQLSGYEDHIPESLSKEFEALDYNDRSKVDAFIASIPAAVKEAKAVLDKEQAKAKAESDAEAKAKAIEDARPVEEAPTGNAFKPASLNKKPAAADAMIKAAIHKKSVLPILTMMHVKDGKGRATDLEAEVEVPMALPDGIYTQAGKTWIKNASMSMDEYPVSQKLEGDVTAIKLSAAQSEGFRKALWHTDTASSRDDSRHVLQSVLVSVESGEMTLVATDGRRLHTAKVSGKVDSPDVQIILPTHAVSLLRRSNGQDPIEINVSGKTVKKELEVNPLAIITDGNTTIRTKLIEGTYPNYKQVMPDAKGEKLQVEVDRKALGQALNDIEPFLTADPDAGDRGPNVDSIKVMISPEGITVRTTSGRKMYWREKKVPVVNVVKKGDKVDMMFNVNFMLDAIKGSDAPMIRLGVTDEMSPITTQDPDGGRYSVLMPLRLNARGEQGAEIALRTPISNEQFNDVLADETRAVPFAAENVTAGLSTDTDADTAMWTAVAESGGGQAAQGRAARDLIEKFKNDLAATTMDAEQRGVYEVMVGNQTEVEIKTSDLNDLEYALLESGSRDFGAKHILFKHFSGIAGPVSAKEVIDIGSFIRGAQLDKTASTPNQHIYQSSANDGARLTVITEKTKDGDRTIKTFYSNRKGQLGTHSGTTVADPSVGSNVPQTGANVNTLNKPRFYLSRNGEVRAVTLGSRSHFFLDRYDNASQLRGDIREEAGHRLINELGGEEMGRVGHEVYRGQWSSIADEIERNYGFKRGTPEFNHELIAKAFRDGKQNASIWRRFLDAIMAAFRRLGRRLGFKVDLSDAEIRAGLNDMLSAKAQKPFTAPEGKDAAKFSRAEGSARDTKITDVGELTGDTRRKVLEAALTKSGYRMQLSSIARKYDLDLADEAQHEQAMKELVAKITDERASKPNVWQRFEEAIGASKRAKVPQKVSERGRMPVEALETAPATREAQEQGAGEIEAGKAVEPPVEAVKTPEIEAKPDLPSIEESGFKDEAELDAAYEKDGLKEFGQTRDQFLMWKWCQSLGKYVQFTRQPRGK